MSSSNSPPRKVARSSEDSPCRAARRRLRSSCPATDLLKCIICQKEKPKPKNRRMIEPLHRCTWDRTPATFVNAARVRDDERVLLEIDGADLHAKDVLYHPSCYKDYTSTRALGRLANKHVAEEADNSPQRRAFVRLVKDVERTVLLDTTSVTNLSHLCAQYNTYLNDEGVESEACRGDFLKARLQQHFGDRLSFHRPHRRNQAQFVFSSDVAPGPLIELCMQLTAKEEKREEEGDDMTTDDVVDTSTLSLDDALDFDAARTVYSAASVLRGKVLDVKNTMPFPPSPTDLSEDKVQLPAAVYNFLSWLLYSPDLSKNEVSLDIPVQTVPPDVRRKIMSIGQDILYCVTHGRVKTPKHVSLSIAVKQMTGSTQVVSMLNHFGHGISETQLSEIDTAMAEEQIRRQQNQAAFLPSNITAPTFITLCWDNNDLKEDTLSGKMTHCTNGIVVQRQVQTAALPHVETQQPVLHTRERRRMRSLAPPVEVMLDYNAGKREGPQPIALSDEELASPAGTAIRPGEADFSWMMARLLSSDSAILGQEDAQCTPSWTAFNAIVSRDTITRPSIVGYLPVLATSPTELSTVFLLLQRSIAVADQLHQEDVVVVLDQAVYAKAAEIVWKHRDTFSRVVLRMGGFHIAMIFLAVIGKRFGDAGLQDVLIESGVVGPSAVHGVLSGKQYNRGIRCHKAMLEALLRMQWHAFESWLALGENANLLTDVREALFSLRESGFTPDVYKNVLVHPQFQALRAAFQQFTDGQEMPLTKFWSSYISMVCLLLDFIRSSREGNWAMHLSSIREMLAWMFAYDRVNYCRYMSLYWCDMTALKDSHPAAHQELSNGEFCVQRSIDVQPNCSGPVHRADYQPPYKSEGWHLIGFSQKPAAVQKWMINAHQRAAITKGCREMAGMIEDPNVGPHKEGRQSRIRHDEGMVQALLGTMAALPNPFVSDESQVLCNLSSGVVAAEDVTADLLNAQAIGEDKFLGFYEQRLKASENRVDFFARLPLLKLKTFSSMIKKKSVKVSGQEVIVRADSKLFARLLIVAQTRAMDIQEVLRYELGPLPWSLAAADGSLCKTTKAKLLALLEDGVPAAEEVPPAATWIVDGMAILQGINSAPATFADLATIVFNIAAAPFLSGAPRVDFVVDQYPATSIKGCERAARARLGTLKVQILHRLQKCPTQWKKYLAVGSNKEDLQAFLCAEWQRPEYAVRLHRRFFYVASGTTCTRLTSPDGDVVIAEGLAALRCSHEEADTRLLLHAAHAAQNGSSDVVIRSPDTDVAVLACTLSRHIQAHLFFRTGTKARSRFIDINAICVKEGPVVCRSLVALHALTGCDSTSSFKRRGKAQGLSIVRSSGTISAGLSLLGRTFDMTEELLKVCEEFVCRLYGSRSYTSINDLRYHLFATKAAQGDQLPPTRDALVQHVKRANYQAGVWLRALEASPNIPLPVGHGWSMQDGMLKINWMQQAPAPEQLIVLVQCNCQKGCENAHCSCVRSGLQCTDACRCSDCSNGGGIDDTNAAIDLDDDSAEECDHDP